MKPWAMTIALAALLGLAGPALASPRGSKAGKPLTPTSAKSAIATYLGSDGGGWNIRLQRTMRKIKGSGSATLKQDGYSWAAISKKKVYTPWDGTEGTPGLLYRVFDGRINSKGTVWHFPSKSIFN